MNYKIVYVTWADAHCSESGWVDLDDYNDDGEIIVHTTGFLIPLGDAGSKDKHVSLWQSLSGGEGIHGFHIPVQMVRNMKTLGLFSVPMGDEGSYTMNSNCNESNP